MTATELRDAVKAHLNRPADDDKFPPAAIWRSLTRVGRLIRREFALWDPELIDREETVAPADATGETYVLAKDPIGAIRVFAPPGYLGGIEIEPGDYGAGYGFVLAGQALRLAVPRVYTPGLFVKYVADIDAPMGEGVDPGDLLPAWAHDCWALGSAARLARMPGSRINYAPLEEDFQGELADLRRQRKMRHSTTAVPRDDERPWYQGMGH